MTEKYVAEVPVPDVGYVMVLWDCYPPKKTITFHPVAEDDDKVIVEVQSEELYDVIVEEFKLNKKRMKKKKPLRLTDDTLRA